MGGGGTGIDRIALFQFLISGLKQPGDQHFKKYEAYIRDFLREAKIVAVLKLGEKIPVI
jgi:hypothetical protein